MEDATKAFDTLLAAAESLRAEKHVSTSFAPMPQFEGDKVVKQNTASSASLKINFSAIHKQIAALQKLECNTGTTISSGAFLEVVPCKSYSLGMWPLHFVQYDPKESVGVNYSPCVVNSSSKAQDQRKSSIAKKLATARREREGGKFKKLKTKWVSATEFFKNNNCSTSESTNPSRH